MAAVCKGSCMWLVKWNQLLKPAQKKEVKTECLKRDNKQKVEEKTGKVVCFSFVI